MSGDPHHHFISLLTFGQYLRSNSDTFSKTFSSADSRTAYVKMLKGYLDTDKWDGVDIDW